MKNILLMINSSNRSITRLLGVEYIYFLCRDKKLSIRHINTSIIRQNFNNLIPSLSINIYIKPDCLK